MTRRGLQFRDVSSRCIINRLKTAGGPRVQLRFQDSFRWADEETIHRSNQICLVLLYQIFITCFICRMVWVGQSFITRYKHFVYNLSGSDEALNEASVFREGHKLAGRRLKNWGPPLLTGSVISPQVPRWSRDLRRPGRQSAEARRAVIEGDNSCLLMAPSPGFSRTRSTEPFHL